MQATEQELKWAAAIKEAALADPDIDTAVLSDLEYLQHAMVAKDCVDKALRRMKRLADFKERFGIKRDGSWEEGWRDLKSFQAAHPGVLLAVETLPDDSSVTACSTGKFYTRNVRSPESLAIAMRGFFYVLQACHSTIPAMRAGMVSVLDNQGAGWKNLNVRVEHNVASLFAMVYPARVNQVVMINCSRTLRVVYKFIKLFLPSKMTQRHEFYADLNSFLDTTTQIDKKVLPTEWKGLVSESDLEESFRHKLQARYELEATFAL